ncbi:MAG: acyltransferase [Cellvibrionales bacterium]|nr:acyltransferase [Cellvibrionales bacterium]
MKRLADHVNSRDNNFNLLRFIAASMVLWGHSWPLTSSGNDPLAVAFEIPAPHMAVDIFFGISGFLVTSSLLSRKNVVVFSLARLLRLVPGLFISTLLTVFCIGLYFTTLPIDEYLRHPDIYQYIWVNSTLLQTQVSLPGVFDGGVNGSLWTLPYEFKMYSVLACIGLLVYVWPRLLPERFAGIIIVAIAVTANTGLLLVAYGSIPLSQELLSHLSLEYWRFYATFFFGGAFFVLRRYIPLNFFIIGLIAVAVYTSKRIFIPDTFYICLFGAVYHLCLVYVALYFSYLPGKFIRKFNKLGDYSYGIYIYAFPIQQSVLALGLATTPNQLFLWAFPPTLLLAILSWHFIEKPALSLRHISKPAPKPV